MNPLLDPLMDTTDGGSSPRRRSLADSMIAGRRRPSTSKQGEDDAKSTGGTSRRRSSRQQTDDETQGTGSSGRRRAPREQAADEEPAKPATRRRRRPTRRQADETSADAPDGTAEDAPESEARPEAQPEPEAESPPAAEPEPEPAEPVEPAGTAMAPAPRDLQGLANEVTELRGVIEQQRGVLAEVRAGLVTLAQQVDRSGYRPRLGVFVDVPNLMYGLEGAGEVHMGKLLDLLREGRELIRATAYSPVSDDPREPLEQQKFVSPFVPYDYRIVTKPLKRFADGSIKGNFDVEMAIDMLSMADRVDVVAIVSGDADFARAVEAVQARGVRVEVIAFAGSTSLEMRALADHYLDLSAMVDRVT